MTKSGFERSIQNGVPPHIRTENVNLHTTFARRRKLFPDPLALATMVIFLVSLVELLVVLALIDLWHFFLQTVVAALLLAAALVGSIWALPRTGWWWQRLRQAVGRESWMYDLLNALRSSPGLVPRLGIWLVSAYVVSGGLTWLADSQIGISDWPVGLLWILLLSAFLFAVGLWSGVIWHDRVGRGLGRDRQGSLPQQVHRLSMVQALSWTPLPPYPARSGGIGLPQDSTQRPLIFVSTFNEGFDGYVGGFVEGMGQQLDGAWGLSPGFPRVDAGFRPFVEYVDRTSYPLQHSFVAYPHCSVVDVRNALHLDRAYRSLRHEVLGTRLTIGKYKQFVERVRMALPSIPASVQLVAAVPRMEIRNAANRANDPPVVKTITAANADTETKILVSVLPFSRVQSAAVTQAIASLPGGFPERDGIYAHAVSPFLHVPGTHFARLTVVDDWFDQNRGPRTALHFEELPPDVTNADDVQPADAWLLLSVQFDSVGENGADDYLANLRSALGNTVVEAIFGPARDRLLPGADLSQDDENFAELIKRGHSEPNVRVVDHPDNTMWDVLRALYTHRVVSHYLRLSPPADPQVVINDPVLPPFRP